MIKISQCMIVKNEEKNIRKALTWGKDIVFEQIVVDTGSTDQTVEIASEMGAKIFHFTWIDDFSAAKNYAIEQASGEWIAFLDADEYMLTEDAAKLPNYLKQLEKTKENIIMSDWLQLNDQGNIVEIHDQTRIFQNIPDIRYVGRIHENIESITNAPVKVANLKKELPIYHTGYAWTEESRQIKSTRNIELLKKELEKTPKKASLHLYLAESYATRKDLENVVYHTTNAIQYKNDKTLTKERLTEAHRLRMLAIHQQMMTKDISYDKIMQLYQEAVKTDASCPDFDIVLGCWMFNKERWEETTQYIEQGLKKAELRPIITDTRLPVMIKETYHRLILAYEHIGNEEKCFYYATLSLQIDPYQEKLIQPLVHRFSHIDRIPKTDIIQFLGKIYQFSKRKDLLFVLKIIKLARDQELEECYKPLLFEEDRALLYPESKNK